MNSQSTLLNSIFFPRPSFISRDDKDHLVEVDKNTEVGVRFFLSDKNFSNILFFHGNAELAQEYNDIAEYYNTTGCNFIVADYRGYGLSKGTPNKENLHSDSQKIFRYVQSFLTNNGYDSKMIIMGRSLGSASACEIIASNENKIDGCIIESGFATEIPLMNILGIVPSEINYDPKDGFENLKKIKSYTKPILIIHSENDDIIPLSEARVIYESVKSKNKKIWIIENANHNNIMMYAKMNYFKKIKSFIDNI